MTPHEKLARLHNGPTRYELIAERGETRVLICYSMRTGRHSLLTAARKHGPALIAMMGLGDDAQIEFLKPAASGARIGDWSIRFSGRTQREAVSSELPWIGDWKAEARPDAA
jgi:hypothetical protein